MKKTGGVVILCILTLLLLSLAGCGGEETYISSPKLLATVPFRGIVEDGPIVGAKISLRDQDGTYYPLYDAQEHPQYEVKTDTEGAFSLGVKAGSNFSNLRVVAVGGIDRDTGMDFSGLEMRSPLGLFQDNMAAIVISPLTTLIADLHDQGFSFEDAENRLRAWLTLPDNADLTAPPSTNLDLQRRTLLLSKIALEIKEINTAQPLDLIRAEAAKPGTSLLDADGACKQEILSALGLDALARERVSRLHYLLTDPQIVTKEEAFFIFKREELIRIFDDNFKEVLDLPTLFDAQQQLNYQKNIELLAEKTLLAAGSEVFLLVKPIPSRLFRYILFTYKLTAPETLSLDVAAFSATLTYEENDLRVALENDPWIALLARSSSANSVDSPLLLNELPGDDNQQRVTYFYGSDLSPHFQAEQLIGRVFDDAINDAVLLKIIEGKANAGLVEETWTIIATQIVQPEPKANAYRSLANALIKYNRMEEARSALDLAQDLYRQVIAAKGIASASSKDIDNIMATSNSYRKAGDLVKAQNLLDYIYDIAQVFLDNKIIATTYGSIITGIKKVADVYISEGNTDAATPLVQAMYYYSGQTPALSNKYLLRVYNWSESAKRYADLGNRDMVMQILSDIQTLRADDGLQNLTEAATWSIIPDLVESLYRVGATGEALTLAESIPQDSTYLSKAYKLVATYEALQGNLETAFSIIDNATYFPKNEDRIELLTYFNNSRPYIGQMLINARRFSEASQALEKAIVLLDGMTASNNLVRISSGYVKVAELYALMGESAKAAALLQAAQDAIIDDVYRVTVMADIALGYHNLGQTGTALTLLDKAQDLADANPTFFRANTILNLGKEEYATLLYEKLVKSYETIGEQGRIATTMVNSFQPWAGKIHTAGTVNDLLAGKECEALLRGALYLDRAGYHDGAMATLEDAKKLIQFKVDSSGNIQGVVIAVIKTLFTNYVNVIKTYASVHEYEQALTLALALPFTSERNQGIQTLANAYIDRDDFPASTVASIDSDGDSQPDFFHPLASSAEIAESGLFLDDDSDGDGRLDIHDIRPLFAD